MAKRRKSRKRTRPRRADRSLQELADAELPEILTTCLEGGVYRRASEVAAEMRRRGLAEAHRPLLERAYRLRTIELARQGLHPEAAALAKSAFEWGLPSRALADIAFQSALANGNAKGATDWAQSPQVEAEARDAFLADLAVLSAPGAEGEAPAPPLPEDRVLEAASVQKAFELHERGLPDEARGELSGIGKRSPLARWRLLLLGLLARASGDGERARQCWERIPALGVPGSLARRLLGSGPGGDLDRKPGGNGRKPAPARDTARDPLPPFPCGDLEDERLPLLREIKKHADAGDSHGTFLIPAVRKLLRLWPGGTTFQVRERLLRSILGKLHLEGDARRSITALLGPVPEDPEFLRRKALALEKEQPEMAHSVWQDYARSFDTVGAVPPATQKLALALVWEHMGDLAKACMTKRARICPCPHCRRMGERLTDEVQPGAAACYRESIRLDPDSLCARKKLVSVLLATGQKKDAEEEHTLILARWPDDVDTILQLGELALGRKAYLKAFRRFEQARALEPLNRAVLMKLADCLVASACRRAGNGRFALARKDLHRALELSGERGFARHYSAWSAVELLAGDSSAAETCLEKAVTGGEWAPSAIFGVAAHLAQIRAPGPLRDGASERLGGAIAKLSLDVPTAEKTWSLYRELRTRRTELGAMAPRHEPVLVRYLERAATLPFPEAKRLEICHGLRSLERYPLLKAFAAAGRKQFPAAYTFPALEADARLSTGERRLPRDLGKALDRAREGAARAGDLEVVKKIDLVKAFGDLQGGGVPGLLERFLDIAGAGDDDDGDPSDLEDLLDFRALLFGDDDDDDDDPDCPF